MLPLLGAGVLLGLGGALWAADAKGSPLSPGGLETTDLWSGLFLGSIAAALVLYLAALYLFRNRPHAVALACGIAVAIQLLPLAGPLLLSRDVYSYWAYGRIVSMHDGDPFSTPPARYPHDPATQAVAPGWRHRTSAYGPAFTAASAAVGDAAESSPSRAAFAFRAIAALAAIGITLLAALTARRKAFAAAFVGWNPIVAISFAGGGHNDAWMLLLMLGGVAALARRRDAEGGTLWGIAGAIKATAYPLLLLQLVRARGRVRIWALGTVVVTAGAATAAFGTAWMTSVWKINQQQSRYSLPSRLEQLSVPAGAAHATAFVVLGLGAAWLFWQARTRPPRLALAASLLVLTSSWVLPWYSTWPIALAAIDEDVLGQAVALGLGVYLLPDRIPF